MLDFRPVLFVLGVLVAMVAGFMAIPALVDLSYGNDNWRSFAAAAAMTLFLAGGVIFAARPSGPQSLSLRQAFVMTTLSWVVVAGFAALPLWLSSNNISYVDAYFEAMSGLTTTGSTVLTGLDHMAPGILLWRALLTAIGGVGIVVLGLAVLPFLQVGGMQLFRTESSDRSEKILPRAAQLAANIGVIYVLLTVACAIAYWAAGMSAFDAISHAMPTIGTGGFANYNESIGYFRSPAIEWVAILFMFLGGGSFTVYILVLYGRPDALWRDSQMRWYFWLCVVAGIGIGLWHYQVNDIGWHDAFRGAIFSVVSIVTTTGFIASDYTNWGSFAVAAFFALTFVGGCTGSTAGGIKVFRFQILFGTMQRQFFSLLNPHGVKPASYEGHPVPPGVPLAVTSFFFLYGLSTIVIAMLLGLMGLDFVTSLSSAATAIGNVGPGLGPIVGPSGNFATLPDGAKVLLAFAMMLGRLELFTVLMMFNPHFWRR